MKSFLKKYWWTLLVGGVVVVAILKRDVIMGWFGSSSTDDQAGTCAANQEKDATGKCVAKKPGYVGTSLTGNALIRK